jgi:hypothetical protein
MMKHIPASLIDPPSEQHDAARYEFAEHVRAGTDSMEVQAQLGIGGREAAGIRRAVLRGE